jgi:hypothetical protein
MLKIAISGTHGVGKTTLANRLNKVLGKQFDQKTELLLVPEYIRSNLRKDIGEQQTEDATLFYIRKAMNTLRIVDGMPSLKIVVFDRPWLDTAIYYLAAKAMKDGATKVPKRRNLEEEIISLFAKAQFAEAIATYKHYDIIIFNRLLKSQYDRQPEDDGVRLQSIEFRNLVNDFFCSLYTPYLKQRSELLPRTRIVINTNPLGCKCSVDAFMRNLVGNEILPAIC